MVRACKIGRLEVVRHFPERHCINAGRHFRDRRRTLSHCNRNSVLICKVVGYSVRRRGVHTALVFLNRRADFPLMVDAVTSRRVVYEIVRYLMTGGRVHSAVVVVDASSWSAGKVFGNFSIRRTVDNGVFFESFRQLADNAVSNF